MGGGSSNPVAWGLGGISGDRKSDEHWPFCSCLLSPMMSAALLHTSLHLEDSTQLSAVLMQVNPFFKLFLRNTLSEKDTSY